MLWDEGFSGDTLMFSLFNLSISWKSGVRPCGLYGKFCLSTCAELLPPRWFSCQKQIVRGPSLCLCLSAFTSFLGPSAAPVTSRQLSFWVLVRWFFFFSWMEYEGEKLHQHFINVPRSGSPQIRCDLSWLWRLGHRTRSSLVSLKMINAFKRFSLLYSIHVNSVALYW